MHPTIYLDTTVIIYLTDPPSPNPITRACQQLTQLWWHTRCDPARTFVSPYVVEEIESGDPLRALRRLRAIDHLGQVPDHEKIESTTELLFVGGGLTARAKWAATHIACALLNHSEVLLTWDCGDITNASKFSLMRFLLETDEYFLPDLVTPFQLMENSYENPWSRDSC